MTSTSVRAKRGMSTAKQAETAGQPRQWATLQLSTAEADAVARAATSITADFAMAPAEFRQQVAEFAKLLSPSTVDALRDLAAGTSERPEICVSGLPVQADLPPPQRRVRLTMTYLVSLANS